MILDSEKNITNDNMTKNLGDFYGVYRNHASIFHEFMNSLL